MACRKRCVEELGRPRGFLGWKKAVVGYAAIETRKGEPGNGVMPKPKRRNRIRNRKAEEYRERESLPDADGESYPA